MPVRIFDTILVLLVADASDRNLLNLNGRPVRSMIQISIRLPGLYEFGFSPRIGFLLTSWLTGCTASGGGGGSGGDDDDDEWTNKKRGEWFKLECVAGLFWQPKRQPKWERKWYWKNGENNESTWTRERPLSQINITTNWILLPTLLPSYLPIYHHCLRF